MQKEMIIEEFKKNGLEILIPSDKKFKEFDYEFKDLYKKNQLKIKDPNSYFFIKCYTLFYAFLCNGVPLGAIYFFVENGKLFLNAFSIRKKHHLNLLCLRLSLTWFNCDVYAEAQNRASAFCLLRCGFKKEKENLFVYKH